MRLVLSCARRCGVLTKAVYGNIRLHQSQDRFPTGGQCDPTSGRYESRCGASSLLPWRLRLGGRWLVECGAFGPDHDHTAPGIWISELGRELRASPIYLERLDGGTGRPIQQLANDVWWIGRVRGALAIHVDEWLTPPHLR